MPVVFPISIELMAHEHSHNHHHHDHHHSVDMSHVNSAFRTGIILNFGFVIIEAVAAIYTHSLSLLSDAGHNLADVGALALSLFAFRLLGLKGNEKYTYGYRKTSILVALVNAVVLLASIAVIFYEGIERLIHPHPVQGLTISIIASIGIVINFVSARLLIQKNSKDLNIRSAYLHLMADALISAAIVVGGILIYYFNWYWLDPLLSIVVAVFILFHTWHLLRESVRLTLDGVPLDINLSEITKVAMAVPGVKEIHHIHVWAMSTTENALTAHLVLADNILIQEERKIKDDLKHRLQHKNIQHITLETERESGDCLTKDC
jgi:cobalt-zinc-cadmium efflux system protein